jgi:lipopolysaccharide transport system permease protein
MCVVGLKFIGGLYRVQSQYVSQTYDEYRSIMSSRSEVKLVNSNTEGVYVEISPSGSLWDGLREIIVRRELLQFLIWRDIKVRYKQTVMGVAWALLVPLIQSLIFTVVFGNFAGIAPDGEYPYSVFVLAGLIPWIFISQGIQLGSQSLVNQQHLLTKIYFPRIFIPTAAVGGCLIDFFIGLLLFAGILIYYGVTPSLSLVALPALVLITVILCLGVVYFLSALTVTYRDFRYVIPFAVQALMYASPIVYPAKLVPQEYQWILGLNPISGIIDAYRSSLLGRSWNMHLLTTSAILSIMIFALGAVYFRSTERRFADIA